MKISRNKKTATITLVLALTITASLIVLPIATAHDPAWTIPTWTYIEAYPDPIGVGQTIFLVFWRDYLPRTAEGQYGDRWDFTITVTKPDNTQETIGPYRCDPVGGAFAFYTPDQLGTYSFVAHFPGLTYGTTGITNPRRDNEYYNTQYVGDVLLPSDSEPATVVVQQDPLTEWPAAELPTDYWSRPVDSSLREWNTISGNWLNDGRPYTSTKGPKTAHIVWVKPQEFGGLTGGQEYGTIGYYEGSSYERKWRPVAIMNGRLYYRTGLASQPATQGTMAVDLRTGEEILFMNRTFATNGVLYNYQSPNQHGTIPYLLASGSAASIFDPTSTVPSYSFYDTWNGEWIFTVTDRPGGISAVGANGEPLIYAIDFNDHWLALWNATAHEDLLGGISGTAQWQWRPTGKKVSGIEDETLWRDAVIWNVTIPADVDGSTSFMKVLSDRILIGDGFQRFGGRAYTSEFTVHALSLEPGHEGERIFSKTLNTPPIGSESNMTLQFEGDIADEEAGIFVVKNKEDLTWYGFDLDTGDLVWGPTEPAESFMMYDRSSTIYNGKLLWDGYSGVYCYDITNGNHLWTFRTNKVELDGPYEYYPVGTIVPVDDKIYVTTGEHSHTQPLYRGWTMYCVDANTGQGIWNITGVWGTPIFADGYMVDMNGMDNQIYCFGKGPTQTTVEAPLTAVPKGNSLIIQGTVIDKSPGSMSPDLVARYPNGLPAMADVDMSAWMEHVYKQHELPMDASGVPVTIDAYAPDGSFISISTVYTDLCGQFSYMWTPEDEGKYTIIATFPGSDSYFSSYDQTTVGVGPAPSPGVEPTTEPPTSAPPTSAPPTGEAPLVTTEVAIVAGVAVAAVIAVAAFWAFRRRK